MQKRELVTRMLLGAPGRTTRNKDAEREALAICLRALQQNLKVTFVSTNVAVEKYCEVSVSFCIVSVISARGFHVRQRLRLG